MTNKQEFKINDVLHRSSKEEIVDEIFQGLSKKDKYISCKFFYDSLGSKLFEEITRLPEYYPSRTEKNILKKKSPEISKYIEHKTDIVELGSGDCSKISIILSAVDYSIRNSLRYIPVDISISAIRDSAAVLQERYKGIGVYGISADFTRDMGFIPSASKRLICFFGSTLGNLPAEEQTELLNGLKNIMKPGDNLLLGIDMVKDSEILESAYNDKSSVTAAFNKNILNVVNRLVNTDFDTAQFEHLAFYNNKESRIEMHLRALSEMEIYSLHFPEKIVVRKGETIHTENSRKFTYADISKFSLLTGLNVENVFMDPNKWFSLVQFIA